MPRKERPEHAADSSGPPPSPSTASPSTSAATPGRRQESSTSTSTSAATPPMASASASTPAPQGTAHRTAGDDGLAEPSTQWWTTAEVAQHCGISRASVRAYVARGILPEPDDRVGRTPIWKPQTIVAAQASRRGQHWRSGSPD